MLRASERPFLPLLTTGGPLFGRLMTGRLAMGRLAMGLLMTGLLLLPAACSKAPPAEEGAEAASQVIVDPHSFARPHERLVRHLDLDLTVDFGERVISGRASLRVEPQDTATVLVLDTMDLTIEGVEGPDGSALKYELSRGNDALGQPLKVKVPPETDVVHVDYRTSPKARALQWLEPPLTATGRHPYLFTQSQAIMARSWVPCQDTPQVRTTYQATVRVPPELMAVMSASNPTERNSEGIYHFRMDQPVPSYLLALAVGDLSFAALGERSGVYAEAPVLDDASYEFAELESMMDAAEDLYGPYRWERYDILVLPPSFPFGGMENPRLTFATPTILAGDRSLVALVAHELAHSWSGNLVTNATWNDLWINEGFTVYFERRIMEEMEGRDYAEMLAQLGYQDLVATVEEFGEDSPLTHLHLQLTAHQDPDSVFSDVPYEKGYFFLRMIEETVGRERFDNFLRDYFETFAFQSLDTAGFVSYLRQNLVAGDESLEDALAIDSWTEGPGIPPNCPTVRSTAFEEVEAQLAAWQEGTQPEELATEDWNTHQWLHFLRQLPEEMSEAQMADLDRAFGFTQTGNSELLHAWLLHAIANRYEPGMPALDTFLTSMGRRKFLRPLYKELMETEEGQALAQEIYGRARPTYHPLAVSTIDAVVGWSGG